MKRLNLRAARGGTLRVDRSDGVIYGASVITAGQTKPDAGSGSIMLVDSVTLEQVAQAINAKPCKVRMTHVELSADDDLPFRVASLRNARVAGDRVVADVHFYNPTDDDAVRCMAIAEDDPRSFGLSICTTHYELTPPDMALRVSALDSVDLVGEPAANPAGMLSANKGQNHMFRQEHLDFLRGVGLPEDAPAESIPAFIDSLTEEQKAAFNGIAGGLNQIPSLAVPSTDGDTSNAALQAERDRARSINNIALRSGLDQSWANQQIAAGTTAGDAAQAALSMMRRGPEDMQVSATRVTLGADLNGDTIGAGITSALALRMGSPAKNLHPRAEQFRNRSLVEMGRSWLMAAGVYDAQGMSSAQLASQLMRSRGLALAQATGDFPHLLADALGKSLRTAYEEYPSTWGAWGVRATAPDFKQVKRNALHSLPLPREVKEGDEYTFVTLHESQEVYQLATYGVGTRMTRQMIINDDLSAFDRLPQMASSACRRLEDDLAYAQLTANGNMTEDGVALFDAAHSNIGTGAIMPTNVSSGRKALAKQTDLEGSILNLRPASLLVPVALEDEARQLVAAQEIRRNHVIENPSSVETSYLTNTYSFLQSLDVVAEPRLDANSEDVWYLAASPQQVDTLEVAFLEGEEAPVVEEEDEFTSDVRNFKVRHNVAARIIDFRGLYRSSGV